MQGWRMCTACLGAQRGDSSGAGHVVNVALTACMQNVCHSWQLLQVFEGRFFGVRACCASMLAQLELR
jgi:hypothetical protein